MPPVRLNSGAVPALRAIAEMLRVEVPTLVQVMLPMRLEPTRVAPMVRLVGAHWMSGPPPSPLRVTVWVLRWASGWSTSMSKVPAWGPSPEGQNATSNASAPAAGTVMG